MARYNTGNPIDSNAMKDLSDNAQNLDVLVNSKTALTQTDRLGVERKTWHGMERDYDAAQASRENQFQTDQSSREAVFSDFLQASGYQDLGEYAPGIEITAHNQYVTFGGQPYLLKPFISVPYTTSGVWTGDDFKLIGDDSLRQDLANPDKGAALVSGAVIYVGSVTKLEGLSLAEGTAVYLTEEGRAGEFVVKTGTPPSDPQKGIYIGLANGNYAERVEKERLYVTWFGAVGDGSTEDTASINGAITLAGYYGTIVFPGGGKSFLITSELIQLEGQQWMFEGGQRASKLLKGYNGNVVQMGSLGRMISPFIDGNGTTYSGTNIVIKSGTFSQYLENVRTTDSVGPGILFEKDAGGGNIINGIEGSTTDPENVGVIALTEDTTAVPRFWNDLWLSGGVLDITGGGNGLAVNNFYIRNILTGYGGATPTRSGLYKFTNGRIANIVGTTTITTGDGFFNNISFSSNLILDDCQGVKFTPTCTFSSITENPNSRYNSFYTQSASPYAVVWSAPDTSLGSVGNGSMLARFARNGHFVKMQFELTFGSTTTDPSGGSAGWKFSLPFPSAEFFSHRGLAAEVYVGSTTHVAFGSIGATESTISFQLDGQVVRKGWPAAWASGDSLFFNIEYEAR